MSAPILLLTKIRKNKPNPYFFFFAASYPHKKSIRCVNFGSLA